jgi:predicted Holliday junction resolvase-like endonuclease
MWAWITLFVVEVVGAIWLWFFLQKKREQEYAKDSQINQLEYVKQSLEERIVAEEAKMDSKQEIIGQMGENIRFLENSLGETAQIVVDLEAKLQETMKEEKKQKGRAQSAHTTKGQILEKWCPFIDHPQIEPHWQPKDWSFMGNPIDYIVWDEEGIVFLDVKAGKSQLTKKQRMIRDLIREGKVEWREIRLQ